MQLIFRLSQPAVIVTIRGRERHVNRLHPDSIIPGLEKYSLASEEAVQNIIPVKTPSG